MELRQFFAALWLGSADVISRCAHLLVNGQLGGGGSESDFHACRRPLLSALRRNHIPGYSYNPEEDCRFWAHYGTRDRAIENSAELDFNALSAFRLSDPFWPPLKRNATMLYIGAHRNGADGLYFHSVLGLQVYAFEPSPSFFQELRKAAGNVSGVYLNNNGVGKQTRIALLRVEGEASATLDDAVSETDGFEQVSILSVTEALQKLPPGRIGLLHINCEGCEYEVFQSLYATGQLSMVDQIQIATHLLQRPANSVYEAMGASLEASIAGYCKMHSALAQTHERSWGLPWVWERWIPRRPDSPRPVWQEARESCSRMWEAIGCWRDSEEDRALDSLEGQGLPEIPGHYEDRVNALQRCAAAACHLKLPGFALQHGGQCLGSMDLFQRYRRYGESDACLPGGCGGALASNVYRFVE